MTGVKAERNGGRSRFLPANALPASQTPTDKVQGQVFVVRQTSCARRVFQRLGLGIIVHVLGQLYAMLNTAREARYAAPVGLCLLITACGGVEPQSFAGAEPRFEPSKFFEGRIRSWGVIEDRSGNPAGRFRTVTVGRREGNALVVTQNFRFEDGRTQRRVWRLRRVGDHRYEATANDVPGVAVGQAFGNAFRWEYTLALKPGAIFSDVRLKHWMYLLDGGGQTMLNRVTISKLGVIVAQVTEYFRRGAGSVPSIHRDH